MNYKYTLIVESELDDVVAELSCLTREGVEEELLRKIDHSIKKYEAEQEYRAQCAIESQEEEEAEERANQEWKDLQEKERLIGEPVNGSLQ